MLHDIWQWLLMYLGIGVVLIAVGRLLVKLFYKDRRGVRCPQD